MDSLSRLGLNFLRSMPSALVQSLRGVRLVVVLLGLSAGVRASAADTAANPPDRETGLPFVELFKRSDYRGHAQVSGGAVDARGLLYFGNYGQVLVYDGVQWDRIPIQGGTFVRSLVIDPRGRLWVGGGNVLGYIDTTALRPAFVSLANRLPAEPGTPGEIVRVHLIGDTVYFRGGGWLFRWEKEKFTAWPISQGGPPWQSFMLGDKLTLQQPVQGWRRVGPEGLMPFERPMPQPFAPVRVALPLGESRTLVGTLRGGFFVYDDRALTLTPQFANEANAYFANHILFDGIQLTDGRYAFTSLNGGATLFRPDLSLEMQIGAAAGLPSDTVNGALADPHGGLWLFLDDGIARIDTTIGATWFRTPTPLGRIANFAFERFRGRLYLGVDRELVRLNPPADGVGSATWDRSGTPEQPITALAVAGDALIVATRIGCYVWHEDGNSLRIGPLGDYFDVLVSPAHPDLVYAAHRDGIYLLQRTGGDWAYAGSVPDFDTEVHQLFSESDHLLWASIPNGGLARLALAPDGRASSVEALGPEQGLPRSVVPVKAARAGGKTLFLTGAGLMRFDATRQRFVPEARYGARFADGSTEVRALVEDSQGGVWIAPRHAGDSASWSETTLGRVRSDGVWESLPVPDLTQIGEINGLRLETEGGREILWVVGVSGILRVDVATLGNLPSLGTALVREVTALDDETPLALGSVPLRLRHEQNSLRFRVAAPGLAAKPGQQFETELVGLGRNARALSASPERAFTNLFEGRYVFRARARALDGRWTEAAEFAFVILPPWWRTPWAYALWTALAAGGVAGVVLLRTQALRARTTALEATVSERTIELHARNQELVRLHQLELDEKTSARLAEEKARLEMLRYQLNPHFLFNTLNSLYGLVENHPAASDMVLRLSEFCRLTLTRGPDQEQALGDELQMIETYLQIEKIRWGDGLRITIDAEAATRSARIPPFLLLPLVENAIKHGGETSRDVLQIRIATRLVESALVIEIANTGRWLAPGTSPARSTHIGLENLRERLRRTYPNAHRFTTVERDGWVIVRLEITPTTSSSASPLPPASVARVEKT